MRALRSRSPNADAFAPHARWRRRLRWTALAFATAALACMPAAVPDAPPYPPVPPLQDLPLALIERVVDGDSLELILEADGRSVRVQLLGVRAPLVASGGEGGEPWGDHAAWALRAMAEGEAVRVQWPSDGAPDRFGRRFALLYRQPDGMLLNLELVRMGLADVPDDHAFEGKAAFVSYADRAAALGRGIWGAEPAPGATLAPGAAAQPSVNPAPEAQPEPAASSTPDAAPGPAPHAGAVRLFVSRSGSKYHRESCRYVTETSREVSLPDARAKYEPCRVCNPPE